jgi:hypothetical protein
MLDSSAAVVVTLLLLSLLCGCSGQGLDSSSGVGRAPIEYSCISLCVQLGGDTWTLALSATINSSYEGGIALLLSDLPLSAFPYNGTGLDVDGLYSGVAAGTVAAANVFYSVYQGNPYYRERVSQQTQEALPTYSSVFTSFCSSNVQCEAREPSYSGVQQYALCAAYTGASFASATSTTLTVLTSTDGYGDLVLAATGGWRSFVDVTELPAGQNLSVIGLLPFYNGVEALVYPGTDDELGSFGLQLLLSATPAVYGDLQLVDSGQEDYITLQQYQELLGYMSEVDGLSSNISLTLIGSDGIAPQCSLPTVPPQTSPPVSSFFLCAQLAGDGWASTIFAQVDAVGPYAGNVADQYYRIINATGQRSYSLFRQLPPQTQTLNIIDVAAVNTLFDNNNRLHQPYSNQYSVLDAQGVVFVLDGIPMLFNETAISASNAAFSRQPLISLRELAVYASSGESSFQPVESDAAGFEAAQADDVYSYGQSAPSSLHAFPTYYFSTQPSCGLLDYSVSPNFTAQFSFCFTSSGPSFASATSAILTATAPSYNSLSEYTVQSATG